MVCVAVSAAVRISTQAEANDMAEQLARATVENPNLARDTALVMVASSASIEFLVMIIRQIGLYANPTNHQLTFVLIVHATSFLANEQAYTYMFNIYDQILGSALPGGYASQALLAKQKLEGVSIALVGWLFSASGAPLLGAAITRAGNTYAEHKNKITAAVGYGLDVANITTPDVGGAAHDALGTAKSAVAVFGDATYNVTADLHDRAQALHQAVHAVVPGLVAISQVLAQIVVETAAVQVGQAVQAGQAALAPAPPPDWPSLEEMMKDREEWSKKLYAYMRANTPHGGRTDLVHPVLFRLDMQLNGWLV
jgi:hypothetical protein